MTQHKPLKMDGFDEAICGVVDTPDRGVLLAYSEEDIIRILMTRYGLSEEDAQEYYSFNILSAWMGPGTPLIISLMKAEDALTVISEIETEDEVVTEG